MNLIFKKNRFWWKFCLQKIFFGPFITQNPNFCSYLLSQHSWYAKKKDNKQFLNEELWKESGFKTSFYNASDFESWFSKNVRFLVNFKQLVIFGIGIFTACQILKNLFTTRQILIRNVNNFFAKPQALKKNKKLFVKVWIDFHIASELESRCLQRIRFRWKKCC